MYRKDKRTERVFEQKGIVRNELPVGWRWVKLGNVADYLNGRGFKKSEWEQSGLPIIRIQNLNKETSTYNYTKKIFDEKYRIRRGDLLFAWAASLGTYIWNGDDAWLNQHIFKIIPRPFCDKLFLFYSLEKIVAELYAKTHGSGMVHVTKSNFENTQIPLPPLEAQHAIVSKIEQLFSELDKGKQQLETVRQQLKVYRQAVLKWAFEGKLTNKNVKEGELPDGWQLVQVKDVADTYGGFAFRSVDFQSEGRYQVLRMGNVRPGVLRYDESPVFLNKVDESILSRSLLRVNDVIITQTGTRKKRDYGFTVLIPKDNLLLNQRIAAIRFKDNYIPKFFLYYSWTDSFKDQFFANETGNVGQGNVGMKAVTETLIPFCPLHEQQHIVQEIESRLSVCDKIEETITISLAQAETLRQSILKKTFEGKLI